MKGIVLGTDLTHITTQWQKLMIIVFLFSINYPLILASDASLEFGLPESFLKAQVNDLLYRIEDDINLNGDTIILKDYVVLKFCGGSLHNGIIIGDNIDIKGKRHKIFNEIYLIGSLKDAVVSHKYFGKYENDTNLLHGMLSFAFSNKDKHCILELEPDREYSIYSGNLPYGHSIYEFHDVSNKTIKGNNACINDKRTLKQIGYKTYDGIFLFSHCNSIKINRLNYINRDEDFIEVSEGEKIKYKAGMEYQLGYIGTSFILLQNDCRDIEVNSIIEGARYGIKSGDYSKYWLCGNFGLKNCKFTIKAKRTGYPLAIEVGDSLIINISSEKHHRAAYLCGISNSDIKIKAKDIYIAPYHCLLSDSRYSSLDTKDCPNFKSCSNLNVEITDTGTEIATNNDSYCVGFQTYKTFHERKYPLVWYDIKIRVNKIKQAKNIGLFSLSRKSDKENDCLTIPDVFENISVIGKDLFPSDAYDLRIRVNPYGFYKNISLNITAPYSSAIIENRGDYIFDLDDCTFSKIATR